MISSAISRVLTFVKHGPPYNTVIVSDLPSRLVRRTLYVVEEDGHREHASMLCPCGCGATIHLNLLPDDRPLWRLVAHSDGAASLMPSVHRTKGCCSHFWLHAGRVAWCRGPGPSWWRRLFSRWF
jgi:hypothetical protein